MNPRRGGWRSCSSPALNRLVGAKSQAGVEWFAQLGRVQFQGFDSDLARSRQQFDEQLSGIAAPAIVRMGEDHANKAEPVFVCHKRGGCDDGSVPVNAETTARRELQKKLPVLGSLIPPRERR